MLKNSPVRNENNKLLEELLKHNPLPVDPLPDELPVLWSLFPESSDLKFKISVRSVRNLSGRYLVVAALITSEGKAPYRWASYETGYWGVRRAMKQALSESARYF